MPRTARSIAGSYCYHVLNRAIGRLRLFKKQADFVAFEQILAGTIERVPLRILGYVLMAGHWHFVVWRRQGEQVSDFFRPPLADAFHALSRPPQHPWQHF